MMEQIGQALFQRVQILVVQLGLGHAAVAFQCPDSGYHHHGTGPQARQTALDVQELFRAQIRAEAGLSHSVIAQLQGHAGGGDGVAAVGDVGEGTAVDQRGRTLQCLHQIGLQCVLQQGGHSALCLQIVGGDRLAVIGVGHDHPAQPFFQIGDAAGETQHRHDLAGHGDVKAVLPGNALHFAADAVNDVAELAVIHIHAALPGDLLYVNAQSVALLNVVIQHGGQQVVGRADGVEIAGEVEVDVLHGDHLSVAAAGGAALDAKHGTERRFPQSGHGAFAQLPQTVGQTHGGGGLALACRGGVDGGHQDQLAIGSVGPILQQTVIDLGLVAAILLQIFLIDPRGGGNLRDGAHPALLGDLNISQHDPCPPVLKCQNTSSQTGTASYHSSRPRFCKGRRPHARSGPSCPVPGHRET